MMTVQQLLTEGVAAQAGMSLAELTQRVQDLRQSGLTEEQIVAWLSYYDPSQIKSEYAE